MYQINPADIYIYCPPVMKVKSRYPQLAIGKRNGGCNYFNILIAVIILNKI